MAREGATVAATDVDRAGLDEAAVAAIEGLVGDARGWTLAVDVEGVFFCTKDGTRVSSVHPGYIRTPMVEAAFAGRGDPEEERRKAGELRPLGWIGEDDVGRIYREARRRTVVEIMSAPVHTAGPGAPLRKLLEPMFRREVEHVPVVEEGRPIGIVARHDLLEVLMERLQDPVRMSER